MDLGGAVGGTQVSPVPPGPWLPPGLRRKIPSAPPPGSFLQVSPGIPGHAGTRGGDGDKDRMGNSGHPKRMGVCGRDTTQYRALG